MRKLKFNTHFAAAIIFLSLVLSGCAGIQARKSAIYSLEIKPERGLKGGTVVTVSVVTGDEIRSVSGTIDIPGAYYAPLRYNAEKKAWIFRDMIPMIPIPPGDYKVIIKAVSKTGETYTAERTVSTN